MSYVKLEDLVQVISLAITEAQDRLRRQQVEHFLNHFNGQGEPVTLELKIAARGDSQTGTYRVPTAPLMTFTPLSIHDATVSLSVPIGGLAQSLVATPTPTGGASIDTRAVEDGVMLSLAFTLKASDCPESMARVMDVLVSGQGPVITKATADT